MDTTSLVASATWRLSEALWTQNSVNRPLWNSDVRCPHIWPYSGTVFCGPALPNQCVYFTCMRHRMHCSVECSPLESGLLCAPCLFCRPALAPIVQLAAWRAGRSLTRDSASPTAQNGMNSKHSPDLQSLAGWPTHPAPHISLPGSCHLLWLHLIACLMVWYGVLAGSSSKCMPSILCPLRIPLTAQPTAGCGWQHTCRCHESKFVHPRWITFKAERQ